MKRLIPTLAIGSGLALALSTGVSAAGTVVTASDSPLTYTSCNEGATTSTSYNYRNSEVEPNVAVNPGDPTNLVGAFQQDRWSNGGAHGLTAAFSTTGGSSWTDVPLPFDHCAAPADPVAAPYNRASDPWVSIGPDGRAYAVSISLNVDNNDGAVLASTSTTKGASWGPARVVKADKGTSPTAFEVTQFFNDKESVTADPSHAGTAYVVWDRLVSPSAAFDADLHSHAFRGPTWFSKTTDGGSTWQTKQVFDPGQNNQTISNVIVVGKDGTLYDFFTLLKSTGPRGQQGASVAFIKSTNGGDTWSGPTIVSSLQSIGVSDPNNVDPRTNNAPAPIRTGGIIVSPAVNRSSGQLYVVWQDSRFAGGTHDDIAISTSTNGGATWTTPQQVDQPNGHPAFTGTAAVASDGTVGVDYFQWGPTSLGSEPTSFMLQKLSPSLVPGTPTVVKGPFNMLDAPFAGGYFVGDYEGLSTIGSSFVPFGATTNCADLSCSALTSVTPPANRTPTNKNSTDVYAGTGF